MRHLSKLNRTFNCRNRFGIECTVWHVFVFLFYVTLTHVASNWKSLNHETSSDNCLE